MTVGPEELKLLFIGLVKDKKLDEIEEKFGKAGRLQAEKTINKFYSPLKKGDIIEYVDSTLPIKTNYFKAKVKEINFTGEVCSILLENRERITGGVLIRKVIDGETIGKHQKLSTFITSQDKSELSRKVVYKNVIKPKKMSQEAKQIEKPTVKNNSKAELAKLKHDKKVLKLKEKQRKINEVKERIKKKFLSTYSEEEEPLTLHQKSRALKMQRQLEQNIHSQNTTSIQNSEQSKRTQIELIKKNRKTLSKSVAKELDVKILPIIETPTEPIKPIKSKEPEAAVKVKELVINQSNTQRFNKQNNDKVSLKVPKQQQKPKIVTPLKAIEINDCDNTSVQEELTPRVINVIQSPEIVMKTPALKNTTKAPVKKANLNKNGIQVSWLEKNHPRLFYSEFSKLGLSKYENLFWN